MATGLPRLVDLLVLTEESQPAVVVPSPKPTWEPGYAPGEKFFTPLEHQVLRSYRTRFNKEWFEVRKILDELQEMTTLSYENSAEFLAPYIEQVDKLDSKLSGLGIMIGNMKTLMAQAGIGDQR